jgi:hypothetical protein
LTRAGFTAARDTGLAELVAWLRKDTYE